MYILRRITEIKNYNNVSVKMLYRGLCLRVCMCFNRTYAVKLFAILVTHCLWKLAVTDMIIVLFTCSQ